MSVSTPFLSKLIQQLRAYSQQDVQSQWQGLFEDLGGGLAGARFLCLWETQKLNDRQHIAWSCGRVLWLYQRFTIPETLNEYPLEGLTLRLSLAWWAEDARLYVNGERVQSGDLFDFFTRFCLSESVMPGQVFDVALRLESPKHDAGALVRSHLIYEAINHPTSPEPGFVADELAVLQYYFQALSPERLAAVDSLVIKEWQGSGGDLHQRMASLRQALLPYSDWLKQRQIHCVGHAHLDLAWLWPVADTWQAAERTFESVLALHQDFPELTYTHSSPALFAWLETHRPELFSRIQQQVKAGKWSIDAGLWVEPELNIVSGEAIARQILYGQRYCQEKFGARSLIAWLPDTFGFCSQLPQLLKLGGVQVFATQKLRWNDTTQFPHELFRWQGPDGSEVLGWTLPPIGTDFDPLKIAEYGAQWEQTTGSSHVCWLPGVGDHGGGPTRDMLMKARRWQASPFFPQVKFSTPTEFLEQAVGNGESVGWALPASAPEVAQLPLWSDELYLELHRGCYTSHSDQKQQNRRAEDLLYQAEVWATVAQLIANQPYPKEQLETAWKGLLFNQFHDILPGSSIPDVFEDANQAWGEVMSIGHDVLETALATVSAQVVASDSQPLLVFNSHSWPRTDVVDVALPPGRWQILDGQTHQPVDVSLETVNSPFEDGPAGPTAHHRLKFIARDVPAVGYRLYTLVQQDENPIEQQIEYSTEFILDNHFLKVKISAETGEILSCVQLSTGREIFAEAANQLQCFEDSGQYWDAWNIAPDYESKSCEPTRLSSIEWISSTTIAQRLRVTRQLNKSTIVQDYVLEANSPLLKIETWVDWQESQVVLKVNFPTTITSEQVTYEVPFGAIQRPTKPTTDHEKAKWEVPALRWADLSDETCGLSILTDCKHGFDAKPHQLRLTLLKAPLWPDPGCDRGYHHFTYAIYPHEGTWQAARTPHHAQALNIPLRVHVPQVTQSANVTALASRSFFQLDSENLLLAALKPSETHTNKFIARYYDAYGFFPDDSQPIANSVGLTPGADLDLLEEPLPSGPARPYQIYTCLLETPMAQK
ncbi:MAG: alpha-mannosidase [Cyanobacteria bacterium P01_D01_bin.56]